MMIEERLTVAVRECIRERASFRCNSIQTFSARDVRQRAGRALWLCVMGAIHFEQGRGSYRGRFTVRQLSRFSSSNSDSVARESDAAFKLYPASSFMSH